MRRSMAVLMVLGGCASGAPRPSVDSPEATRRHFEDAVAQLQKAAVAHAQDDPAVARTATETERTTLIAAAAAWLTVQHVPHVLRDGALVVEPHASALGEQVRWARELGNVSCVYDPFFLVTHPYAAASFDGKANVLYLPHAALLDVTRSDATVRHEMVHVKTWANLRARQPAPYYGFLHGPPYQPNDLRLDEMKAYEVDLRHAAQALRALTPDEKAVKAARLEEILKTRQAEGRPAFALTPLEAGFDSVVSKVFFGTYHTLPALEGLTEALTTLLNGQPPRMTTEADVPLACVTSARPMPDTSVEVTACVALVHSHGADDPNNTAMMKAQLEASLEATRAHAALQQTVLDGLAAAVATEDAVKRWEAVVAAVAAVPAP